MNSSRATRLAIVLVCVLLPPRPSRASPVRGEAPHSSLTLDRAIRLVLEDNPDLKAASFEIRGADVRHEHAGKFRNPRVGLELEDFLGSGSWSEFSGVQTTLRLSQSLDLSGRLGKRVDVAGAQVSVARAREATLRVQIVAETVVRFVHVVVDQQRLAIALKASALSEDGVEVAKSRAASGAASGVEERRASIALSRSRIETEHAEHELLASKRRLAMMWGATEIHFDEARAELTEPPAGPTYEDLAARIEDSPELARFAKELSVQSAELALADTWAIPEVEVAVGGRRQQTPEAYGLVFSISAPLPVFQRNQAAIGAAAMKRSELEARQQSTRVELLDRLYGHTQELGHARDVLEELHSHMLPDAQSVLELVTTGFSMGRFSQIELLHAQHTLIELERERVDAVEEVWERTVRINSILGVQTGLETPPTTDPSQSAGERDE